MSVEARYLEPDIPEELGAEYRRTFERLRGHFRVRGICPEEASDMAQEAAMRAFMHVRRRGMTGDNLFPLINQIARNMLIDRHRRGGPTLVALDDAEPVADTSADPTEQVVSLEASRAVREAVGALPDRHRDAILYALAGMTPAQVGERMGIGRNAADALLHRARRSLKDRLRSVGEGTFGIAALVAFRVRETARRAGVRMGIVDPSAAGALQGSLSAVAAALVVAMNIGNPLQAAAAQPSFAGHVRPAAVSAQAPAVNLGGASGASIGGNGGGWNSFTSGPVDAGYSGNLVTNGNAKFHVPSDQHKTLVGVDYEVWEPDNHSGAAGGQEDVVSQNACGNASSGCEALRKGFGF
ncbi:MAG: RNA polymerase sigma factor [Actinomycetota bacterium]|nr:sigma-70 family RNA polymerase sigma factor [Actinomycetota bacterium]